MLVSVVHRLFLSSVVAACAAAVSASSQIVQAPVATPGFNYSRSLGCGDVFFYATDADAREVLWVAADFRQLRRSRAVETFDLAAAPTGLVVQVEMYPRTQFNIEHCNDVRIIEEGQAPVVPMIWKAIRGKLVVERGRRGTVPEEPWLFRAKIRLEDAVFHGPGGQTLSIRKTIVLEGSVGWQAG